jgi:hypothetical protein
MAAVDLDDVVDVDLGHPQGDQDLDDELVARGGGQIRRGAEPLVQLLGPVGRDLETLLGALLLGIDGLDQSVPLEALEGGVHLAHVEGPDVARLGLELLTELESVLGTLGQEPQKGVPDAHDARSFSSILSIIWK